MSFIQVIDQVVELLRQRGRLSYRVLKREFALDDEQLEDVKEDLIEVQELAVDKDGKMLVWVGDGDAAPAPFKPQSQSPASYTPQHLAERILAEQAAMESRGAADGERKTITALFADLKGSTALIEGLDPEDARAIIDPALQLMMDAVHRYDGYVAQALGDGIFALFGAPIAHEDHPQRALYAALRMQEEMRGYADTLREQGRPPLLMRVGVNTGEVVVRSIRKDDLHADYVPVGHSTNLAARMEQLATPGSIVISEYTRKLTEGYFELKALGAADIKGVEEPLNVYEVVGAGPLRTRFQVTARRGLIRFVGRQSELDQMGQALEQAKAGHGQIVGVMGEPGLGKSRLFYEFKLTSQSGCLVLEAVAVSHGRASPYLPLIELLEGYFQIEPTDDERICKEKVSGRVLTLDRSLEEILPYLFWLLSTDNPHSSLQQMDAQIRRQRTFDAVKKLFLRESLNQPLILIFEDLHWLDTETQGFLDTLSESLASTHVLLLVNYRPEYRHAWGTKTYYTQLRLAPLGQAEAEELLAFLLGKDVSFKLLKELILGKTEGTPFFMEEVVQTLVEEGVLLGTRGHYRLETTPTALHISPTVQGVLAARIDRLTAEEKALLQQLSVIGRQFPVSLVKQVVQQPEVDLYRVLSSLQAKEFLYEQPTFPEVEYLFKHALTHDVAYGTVLQEQRKALHERTAQAIEELHASALDGRYSELAHHYSRSGNAQKAVDYLLLAAQQATQQSASKEAINHLTRALDLLRSLPATPARTHQELALHITLGGALVATKGYGAPEVEQTYTRARALCQEGGDAPERLRVLLGLTMFYAVRGEQKTALPLAEQVLQAARQAADSHLVLQAHALLGNILFFAGDFSTARAHLEHGLALYDPLEHGTHAFQYGLDPEVSCRRWLAPVLWMLGYPEQALQSSREALTRAQELAQPFNLVGAFATGALFHLLRRDGQTAQAYAENATTLADEQGFPYWSAVSRVFRSWGLLEQTLQHTGLLQLHNGMAKWQATGAGAGQTMFSAVLAEAYGQMGNEQRGLTTVAEAMDFAREMREGAHTAELYRLKGKLLLQQSEHQHAEAALQTALDIARHQAAKSLELRAATSLARLWQSRGKQTEAHALLAPVYEWFTEGFDTADLKDAKVLLQELC